MIDFTSPWFTTETTYINPLASIGDPPEHRDHPPHSRSLEPVIGEGARISAFVTVDAGTTRPTTIGRNVFLMAHTHIGHDCIVGDGCELAAGTVLAGWVELGENVRVGVNACFKNRVKVGAGARIGAGAVVVKDVPAGEVWVGNPAREISHRDIDPLWEQLYGTAA